MAMLEVRDLRKSFYTYAKPGLQAGIFHKPGARKVVSQLDVLKGVDLTVNKGDVVAILGPSGSGKTTFLRCLNFLETTDSGTLIFDGEQFDLGKITKADIARLRKKTAFVFQNYNLLPILTAAENICAPMSIGGRAVDERYFRELCETLAITERLHHLPSEMSGGECQRVAVARAMITHPAVLFADEPTGNLDKNTAAELMALLKKAQREFSQTIVMVTHDPSLLPLADRVFTMANGTPREN